MNPVPDQSPSPPGPLKPHRGQLLAILGVMSVIIVPLILAPITWLMARNDLKEMDAGRMDPAGRQQTETARLLAMLSTLAWPVLLSCCCVGVLANQWIQGSRVVPAVGSRPITEKEFARVKGGMTKEQVKTLIGTPARTEVHAGRVHWFWEEKDGRATFDVDFDGQGRVSRVGVEMRE
jgi:outer membrane protein assembly factor BamE (lipoprotein component of BamABCDE complex)